jgi:hypothetical protein
MNKCDSLEASLECAGAFFFLGFYDKFRINFYLNFIQHISTTQKKLGSSTSLLVTVLKESFVQNYNALRLKSLKLNNWKCKN